MYIFILSIVVTLSYLIALNFYLPRRLAYLFELKKSKYLSLFFVAFTVIFFLSMSVLAASINFISSIVYIICMVFTGIIIYLTEFLLGFEIINLFKKLPKKRSGKVIIVLTFLVSAAGLYNATRLNVSHVNVKLNGLEKELRVMHLSDIHVGNFRGKAHFEKIVAITNELEPDLVLITGDIIDSRRKLQQDVFSSMKNFKMPVYFTDGNHDRYMDIEKVVDLLKKNNVNVLRNQIVDTLGIQLVGLNYMRADENTFDHHAKGKETIKSVLSNMKISEDQPSILLHHSPEGIEYASQKGIDLVLSGHTHGGQMFPFNLVTNLIFSYNKGLHKFNNTQIYVSQGAGTFGPPFRLGTNNEITLITITK